MYRKSCIDVMQFCNDLCIGHNVAMIRDTFVALWCSPIHAEPTGSAVELNTAYIPKFHFKYRFDLEIK